MSRFISILLLSYVGLTGCGELENSDMERDELLLASSAGLDGERNAAAADSARGRGSRASCGVMLEDSFNMFTTLLFADTSKHRGARFFTVVDQGMDETVVAYFARRNAPLVSNVSVPEDTLNEIRRRYQAETTAFHTSGVVNIDMQLTYILLPGARCTRDEFAMILFFVDEWLYFG